MRAAMTRGAKLLVVLGTIVVGANLFFAWLGYFGGATFIDMPPTGGPKRPFAAVLMSGDLGLKIGMGPQVAARLTADGIPLVGVNTLSYFRVARTPAETTALIAAAIQRALDLGHVDKVVLIGQSFGSDMLQVGVSALPPEVRAKVLKIAIVVPGDTVAMRTSPSEIYGPFGTEADARPTAARITWAPLLCVYGVEETDSLCPLLKQRNARIVGMPGGHPMHRDDAGVHRAIAHFLFS